MKQEINRHEILEKITPLIENTSIRYGFLPIEIEFIKEMNKLISNISVESKEKQIPRFKSELAAMMSKYENVIEEFKESIYIWSIELVKIIKNKYIKKDKK